MSIKSFRGKLADGATEIIRLGTNQGMIGYRVVKFQCMPVSPGTANTESVCQLYSEEPAAAIATVNFDNPLLLGVNYSRDGTTTERVVSQVVIFDHVKVNQDMYITHVEASGSESVNFYIELEQFKLSLDEATVATLKDMRGNYTNQDP